MADKENPCSLLEFIVHGPAASQRPVLPERLDKEIYELSIYRMAFYPYLEKTPMEFMRLLMKSLRLELGSPDLPSSWIVVLRNREEAG